VFYLISSIQHAQAFTIDCHPEQLITDGKYLTSSSLVELVNSIAHASLRVYSPHSMDSESAMEDLSQNLLNKSKLSQKSEYEMVFLLELATSVVLENKDRLVLVWPTVNRHLQFLLSSHFGRNPFIVERAVVSILRIVNRNLFRLNDEKAIGEEVLICLSHLLVRPMNPATLLCFSIIAILSF